MSHLEALSRVSFDLGIFARVARQRLRRTFAYLLLLVVLSTVATTTSVTLKLRELVKWIEPHLDEIPTIVIKNGQASTDVEQPWVKRLGKDDAGHEVVAIIDTTGARQDFGPNEVGAFLKKREIVIKTSDGQRAASLERVPDATIGPAAARRLITRLMRQVPFYVAGAVGIYYLFAKSMQALMLVLAVLIGASGRRALPFGALFSVAVYALTPVVLLDCALPFLPIHLPMFWLLYFAIAIAYAILGGQRAAAEPPDSAAL